MHSGQHRSDRNINYLSNFLKRKVALQTQGQHLPFSIWKLGDGLIERLQAFFLLHHFPCCRLKIDQGISAEAFLRCFSNHGATATTNNFDSLITTNSKQPTFEVIFLPIAR